MEIGPPAALWTLGWIPVGSWYLAALTENKGTWLPPRAVVALGFPLVVGAAAGSQVLFQNWVEALVVGIGVFFGGVAYLYMCYEAVR